MFHALGYLQGTRFGTLPTTDLEVRRNDYVLKGRLAPSSNTRNARISDANPNQLVPAPAVTFFSRDAGLVEQA